MTSPSAHPVRRIVELLARTGLDVRPLWRRTCSFLAVRIGHQLQVGQSKDELRTARRDIDETTSHVRAFTESLADLHQEVAQQHEEFQRHAEQLNGRLAVLTDALAMAQRENAELRRYTEQLEMLTIEHPLGLRADVTGRQFPSPVVSILMATRNRAHCIGDAIQSAQSQGFSDWELVIVDDGSTDNTAEVVQHFASDRRIRYVRQEPQGLAAARNHSFRLAKGALFAYLDDDNLLYRGFLSAAVSAFAKLPDVDCLYGALVTDAHLCSGRRLLFEQFDRERLLRGNFIDMGALVHRRELIDRFGGIDEDIECLCDWDFILRVTVEKPPERLPVLATRYRVMDETRQTAVRPYGVDYFKIRRKWLAPASTGQVPRVLYVLRSARQAHNLDVQTELRCLRQWGVGVTVWPGIGGGAAEDVATAIANAEPEIIHLHEPGDADDERLTALSSAGAPMTVSVRRSQPTPAILAHDAVRWVYCGPNQIAALGSSPKLRAMNAAFDASLFRPSENKDRRLVLQILREETDQGLQEFFEFAARLPGHRFIATISAGNFSDGAIARLTSQWQRAGASGELLVNTSREVEVSLLDRAGIYLDTSEGANGEIPHGLPACIAEAMATGAYIVTARASTFGDHVNDAGKTYRDVEEAVALINETTAWKEADWHEAWRRSVNRSFTLFPDELVLQPLVRDWCDLLDRDRQPSMMHHSTSED